MRRARRAVLAGRAPSWGDLRRRDPFDTWGAARGVPIDRFYIDRFVERHRAGIRGRVLEVGADTYTARFGTGVERTDVLDVDPGNPAATIVGDLARPGTLPTSTFDCFLCLQTLQYTADPVSALAEAYRALRPGGVLLLSLPALTRVEPADPDHDRHRFTPAGVAGLLATLPDDAGRGATLEVGGNLTAAVAFLLGLAADDLRLAELEHRDEAYPVVCCARVVRAPAP